MIHTNVQHDNESNWEVKASMQPATKLCGNSHVGNTDRAAAGLLWLGVQPAPIGYVFFFPFSPQRRSLR
jgi:hypothetical protein